MIAAGLVLAVWLQPGLPPAPRLPGAPSPGRAGPFAPGGQGDSPTGFEALEAELARGRFRAAEAALAGEKDGLRRAWGEVELAFRGRDFPRALARAEAALERFPDDPRLRLRATASALWLERPGRAAGHLAELERVVGAMEPEVREAWSATAADLARGIARRRERDADLARHLRRARAVAWTGLALVLGALLAGALGAQTARR